jgi:hypothetical protein
MFQADDYREGFDQGTTWLGHDGRWRVDSRVRFDEDDSFFHLIDDEKEGEL